MGNKQVARLSTRSHPRYSSSYDRACAYTNSAMREDFGDKDTWANSINVSCNAVYSYETVSLIMLSGSLDPSSMCALESVNSKIFRGCLDSAVLAWKELAVVESDYIGKTGTFFAEQPSNCTILNLKTRIEKLQFQFYKAKRRFLTLRLALFEEEAAHSTDPCIKRIRKALHSLNMFATENHANIWSNRRTTARSLQNQVHGMLCDIVSIRDPRLRRALSMKRQSALTVLIISGRDVIMTLKKFLSDCGEELPPLAFLPTSGWSSVRAISSDATSFDDLVRKPVKGFLGFAIDYLGLPEHLEGLRRTVLWGLFRDMAVFETLREAKNQSEYSFWVALDQYDSENSCFCIAALNLSLSPPNHKIRRFGCGTICRRPPGVSQDELTNLARSRVATTKDCLALLRGRMIEKQLR